MNQFSNKTSSNKGFTLIELSIVLVIIGLIVGGVLVGQDLIKAAELRATVSQKESYDSAVNTFRLKFNGLPGDIVKYANFTGTLTTTGLTGANGFGDGDTLIEGIGGAGTDNFGFVGEAKLFWRHLADVDLIGDDISGVTTGAAATHAVSGSTFVPEGKMGKGTYFHIASSVGRNYFTLSGITTIATATSMNVVSSDVISPNEAFQLDTKFDDGVPITGVVRSIASVTTLGTAPGGGAATGNCYDTDTDLYATATASEGDALTCVLRIRASF